MKILKVEKIIHEDGVFLEVTIDDNGLIEMQTFEGNEWLEEIDEQPKFLKRVVENLPGLRKAREQNSPVVKKQELKKFKDKEVEV